MNKKKLLLINPKSGKERFNFRFFPPISLGIIEALTPGNWTITIADENIEDIPEENFDLVGITTTHYILQAYKIAEFFRKRFTPVIMGGLHVSAVPDEAMKFADSIVIGEVESVWKQIINDFETDKLKKVYRGTDNAYEFIEPSLNYFDNKYFAYSLETSRGCVNNCIFCGIHIPFHRLYKRKPISIIIEELKKKNNPFVFIIDNNFYGNDDSFLIDLFDEIKKNKIRKTFFAAVSTGFFKNEELLVRAAKCGLKMVFVGFESDTEKSLSELNKRNYINPNDIFNEYRNIIKLSHKSKILVSGKVIIGNENDTEEIIQKRIDFFHRLRMDEFSFGIITSLPGSGLFKKFQNQERLLFQNFPFDWANYSYENLSFLHKNIIKKKMDTILAETNFKNRPKLKKILKAFLISRSLKGGFLYYAYCHYFFYYHNPFISKLVRIYAHIKNIRIPSLN